MSLASVFDFYAARLTPPDWECSGTSLPSESATDEEPNQQDLYTWLGDDSQINIEVWEAPGLPTDVRLYIEWPKLVKGMAHTT